ncbi:MAG: hypothetical protein ABSB42_05155 [Tepidisphaeraceae bacterium]|jgi:hypothetical protein
MSDVEKTPASPTWDLYLFKSGKRARLDCHLPDAPLATEFLYGRWARVICLLQLAYEQDEHLPSDLRGFRQAKELAEAFDEDRRVDPILPSTITTYLYKMCALLKIPACNRAPFPPLIDRVPNSGARLLYPVKIHLVGGPAKTDRDLHSSEPANG